MGFTSLLSVVSICFYTLLYARGVPSFSLWENVDVAVFMLDVDVFKQIGDCLNRWWE